MEDVWMCGGGHIEMQLCFNFIGVNGMAIIKGEKTGKICLFVLHVTHNTCRFLMDWWTKYSFVPFFSSIAFVLLKWLKGRKWSIINCVNVTLDVSHLFVETKKLVPGAVLGTSRLGSRSFSCHVGGARALKKK